MKNALVKKHIHLLNEDYFLVYIYIYIYIYTLTENKIATPKNYHNLLKVKRII